MCSGTYDRMEVFSKQKRLLTVKRDRLNRLLNLLERLEKGEVNMSFKEFDMSEYIEALEQFKIQHEEQIVKQRGSVEKFNEFVQKIKDDETSVAQIAIKQFGSIDKYTEVMKYNLQHFEELINQADKIKEQAGEIIKKRDELHSKLTDDLSRDIACSEVQKNVRDIVKLTKSTILGMNLEYGH